VCRCVSPPILQTGNVTNHLGVCPQYDIQYEKLTVKEVGVSCDEQSDHMILVALVVLRSYQRSIS